MPIIPQGQFCPDGSQAISTCVNGACQPNFACTGANICCSLASVSGEEILINNSRPTKELSKLFPGQFCPTGGSPTSNCVNGVCPAGYYCAGVLCCPGGDDDDDNNNNYNNNDINIWLIIF